MSAQQNRIEINIGDRDLKHAEKNRAEFVVVDQKTQEGYLTFYRIDELTANAIIAAANVILRNSKLVPRNDA